MRKINPRLKFDDYDFGKNAVEFLNDFPSESRVAFEFLRRKAVKEPELLLFLVLEDCESAESFRNALELLSREHVRIVLLFYHLSAALEDLFRGYEILPALPAY